MSGKDLLATDHIVRYVKATLLLDDGSVSGGAFELRPQETGVSVHWLEAFLPGKSNQLAEVRRRSRLTLRRSGRFAELNVGSVIKHVEQELRGVRIVHDPLASEGSLQNDPSHAQINGLPPTDSPDAELIGDLIAERVNAVHPAVVGGGTP